jgi:Tfp pilus assembly protein PilF
MKRLLKSAFILMTINLLLTSCATTLPEITPKTVYSDLFPQELTRTQYYEHLGQNYFFQNDFQSAAEMFRLSVLHDPKNQTARFSLAKSYIESNQNHLALIEFEKYFSTHPEFKGIKDQDMQLASLLYEKSNSFEKVLDIQKLYFEKSNSIWALWKIYEIQNHLRDWPQALVVLDQLKEKNQDLYRINLAKSEIFEKQKKWSDVLTYLEMAEKEKPLDELVMRKKIQVLFDLKNWIAVNFEGEKYNKYHPYHLDISEKWSYSAIQTLDYDVALSELKKQKKMFPDSIGLEFKIAHVLFLMKDYKTAEAAYADLYTVTESDQSVFYLAQIHMINNRFDEAAEKMQLLMATSEYYPTAQIQLSRLEWKNQHKDLALNRMRRAHLMRPDSQELYQEYAQYLIWTKNYVESVALLEKANQYFPKNDQLKLLSAYNHFKLNNQKRFNQDIKSAIALNPKNSEIYAVLSELWYEKRKPASEIQYLSERAIALNSENKNVKPLLAWALLQQDQLTKSVAMFEDFYDQNPNEVFYAESLAEIYALNALPVKTFDYEQKTAELKLVNQLKNEINFFLNQNQIQKTDTQNTKSRLPASLDQ